MLRLALHSRRKVFSSNILSGCACLRQRRFSQLANVVRPKSLEHPTFSLSSKDVTILSEPREFYRTLLDMVKRARRRIFISSLYIGTEEVELIDTLHHALSSNPTLSLSLLLDLRRSTRPGPSTAQMLLPLLRSFPDRAEVRLFQSPKLRGLMAKLVPRRFDEGWGTWHAKVYGVDEEVMFSGANLNTSYFTDRQDRYLHFANQPLLAQYCVDFLQLFGRYSFRLLPSVVSSAQPDASPASSIPDDYTLEWTNPSVRFPHIEPDAERDIKALQTTTAAQSRSQSPSQPASPSASSEPVGAHDTLLRPLIQAGVFNIREEESVLTDLISSLGKSNSLLDLTSGYFALHEPYQRALIASKARCRVLAAGPKANGFYGSPGLSGRIPEAYTLFERRFWRKVRAAGLAGERISLSEWERDGWTYHAKGMWAWPAEDSSASPSPQSLSGDPARGPHTTLFGSTNLNSRSAELDTELSFLLSTSSPALRGRLGEEVARLRRDAREVDEREWRRGERRVRWGTRALLGVMGGML